MVQRTENISFELFVKEAQVRAKELMEEEGGTAEEKLLVILHRAIVYGEYDNQEVLFTLVEKMKIAKIISDLKSGEKITE